ncbi:MAG: prephenate dehydratase [Halobacteriaceae archaeon]
MRTVTLGPAGSYAHRASKAVSDDVEFRESMSGVVSAVAGGEFGRGVIPVENSIGGSVNDSLDALEDHDVAVVREVVTPIRHALMTRSEGFETVASHAQALSQCHDYLAEHYPDADQRAVASTARAVELAREEAGVAAIAHPANAGDDLTLVAEDIQDQHSNATRFFAVAPPDERSAAGGKSSIIVYPNTDYPGLLLELLEPFADRDINLTRLESRPSGDRLGDYIFHVDFEAGLYEQRTQDALAAVDDLVAEDGWIRRLGSYDVEHVV